MKKSREWDGDLNGGDGCLKGELNRGGGGEKTSREGDGGLKE